MTNGNLFFISDFLQLM